ncbi:MAG TPA: OmpA family protein [Sphingobacterium sp.]|nr:OmpA family protein [Sphingobacterium sp.]
MKKYAITFVMLFVIALFIGCTSTNQGNKSTEDIQEESTETSSPSATDAAKVEQGEAASFNINTLPVSDADIGDFPFFTLPEGLKSQNKPLQKNFDVCFFPVEGVMTSFEGKLYKINVIAERGEEFSQRYFEKSIEDYLQSIGAVKVFDGTITQEEYQRYNEQDPNKGADGDIGYANQQIKFYALRTKDKGNIYIQFTANSAAGKLNILQEEAFQQTIKKVTADDIVNDLNEKGKSIIYINFDTDKSNIKPEGKEVVDQIAKALRQDVSLKISIEGHTDNTGDASHNKKLSNERADAVMQYLIGSGIDQSRLSAQGFGAEKPLVANDSEENKSKNRRVELVKK